MGGAFVIIERIVNQERGANKFLIEHRELTLPFERNRVAESIRIARDSRLHLAACVELPAMLELPTRKKIAGIER